MAVELSLKNSVFSCFAFYATVCVLKLILMGLLTSYYRLTKKVFANPEDVRGFGGKGTPGQIDPDVERARRNHLNDIENIIPFVLIGVFYVLTGPVYGVAKLHFQIFTLARVLHTIVYQFAVPQPARALMHTVSLAVCLSMAYAVTSVTSKAF